MRVYFFTVKARSTSPNIQELIRAFGPDHPQPLPLEGDGIQYLLCLRYEIDYIVGICESLQYDINGLWEDSPMFRRHAFTRVDVDPAKYTSEHRPKRTYGREQEQFVLERLSSSPLQSPTLK